MTMPDGKFLVCPKKPVLVMSAKDTAHYTGLSTKSLKRLAKSGFIRCEWPTPHMARYYPGEIFEFIKQTRDDPDFWTPARLTEYGLARNKTRNS